jgi:hypothetical protein
VNRIKQELPQQKPQLDLAKQEPPSPPYADNKESHPTDSTTGAPPPEGFSPSPSGGATPVSTKNLSELQSLDMVEEGVEKALVFLSDPLSQQSIESTLQKMDFYISSVPTSQHAVIKLSNNPYDLVLVDEDFLQEAESEDSFYHYVHSLPMYTRRTFMLCLLSSKYRTLDQLTAFRLGFNLILNAADLEKTKMILERAMREYKGFYRALNSELQKRE